MVKKTDVVRSAVAAGDMRKALSIAKGFKLGITKEQHDDMTRAHEAMTNSRFYEEANDVQIYLPDNGRGDGPGQLQEPSRCTGKDGENEDG